MLLATGSRGPEVREVATLLVTRGYLDEISSVFDSRVKAAVEEFQARHVDSRGRPLVADGKVGPLTWWALRNPDNSELLDEPPPSAFLELPPGGSPAGRSALAAAIGEMRAGGREVGANNSGHWVEKYLNNLTAAPANWCAGFVG